MIEKDLKVKYLVLKIDDIHEKLDNIDTDRFWNCVRKITE